MKLDILNQIILDLKYPASFSSNNVFIVDITGNDSIAALIKTIEINSPAFIIPSVISLACEYGDKSQVKHVIDRIQEIYNKTDNKILPGIMLDMNKFWKLFIAHDVNMSIDKYSFFSPCISCHLIMHLARIKLAQHLKVDNVVSGERELHADREKINQLDFVLDFYNNIYSAAGIKHHTPIRSIKDNNEIHKIVQSTGAISIKLDCLFSGTYYNDMGQISFNKEQIYDYVDNHLTMHLDSFPKPIDIICTTIE